MPLPKQTQDLIFALQALVFRLRQLKKERQGYSKAKHRELAKLLKEGREDLARIKTEDAIANDNLIAALEVLELHCEQLQVRANILDHLAFGQKKNKPHVRHQGKGVRDPRSRGTSSKYDGSSFMSQGAKPVAADGWSFWSLFGFSSASPSPTSQQDSDTLSSQQSPVDGRTLPLTSESEADLNDRITPQHEVYIEPDLDQSAAVVFYSYARIPRDIPGLMEVKNKLTLRWGSDFASRAQDDDDLPVELPEVLLDRLRVRKAPESLVEGYLSEIARSHRIPFGDMVITEQESVQEAPSTQLAEETRTAGKPTTFGSPKSDAGSSTAKETESKLGGIPEVDELARRFAALKK